MGAAAYESFGLTSPPAPRAVAAADAIGRIGQGGPGAWLAYGNGRSYGDSCQNAAGTLIDMRGMNRILSFDADTGLMEAEAGVLLSDIIAYAAPFGFFPAVVPGTQFVTLGGAIANDVHGKNHHLRGTFGRHVESISLLRSDDRIHTCTPVEEVRLFEATIGGMGLTGVILSATIRLMRVPSLDIMERVVPFEGLDAYFDVAEAADAGNEYAVAWIDQLAGGRHLGRGLLLTGNHAPEGALTHSEPRARFGVPFRPPVTLLNRPFLSIFNRVYRIAKARDARPHAVSYQGFFFPLDGVRDWNRLYGPRGLFQHQSVLPHEAARTAVPALLAATREAGQGSFLTVLKRFGSLRSPGTLSFPMPGYTLTLDFPNRGERTLRLLERLDAITVDAGGRVNPYKDARMSPEAFGASFPHWQRLETLRDPAFQSDFWVRTALRLRARMTRSIAAAE